MESKMIMVHTDHDHSPEGRGAERVIATLMYYNHQNGMVTPLWGLPKSEVASAPFDGTEGLDAFLAEAATLAEGQFEVVGFDLYSRCKICAGRTLMPDFRSKGRQVWLEPCDMCGRPTDNQTPSCCQSSPRCRICGHTEHGGPYTFQREPREEQIRRSAEHLEMLKRGDEGLARLWTEGS